MNRRTVYAIVMLPADVAGSAVQKASANRSTTTYLLQRSARENSGKTGERGKIEHG
jgi:hypothetical protein